MCSWTHAIYIQTPKDKPLKRKIWNLFYKDKILVWESISSSRSKYLYLGKLHQNTIFFYMVMPALISLAYIFKQYLFTSCQQQLWIPKLVMSETTPLSEWSFHWMEETSEWACLWLLCTMRSLRFSRIFLSPWWMTTSTQSLSHILVWRCPFSSPIFAIFRIFALASLVKDFLA